MNYKFRATEQFWRAFYALPDFQKESVPTKSPYYLLMEKDDELPAWVLQAGHQVISRTPLDPQDCLIAPISDRVFVRLYRLIAREFAFLRVPTYRL